jgi:hypothetical protein
MAACSSTQKIRFQLRRALESEWISSNPFLLEGEPAVSTDTKQIKIGDGNRWIDTDYINLAGGVGAFGTPTTLATLITLTANTKVGTTVTLVGTITVTKNQPVRFINAVTDSQSANNIIANKIYFAFDDYTGASAIEIKTSTAEDAPRY